MVIQCVRNGRDCTAPLGPWRLASRVAALAVCRLGCVSGSGRDDGYISLSGSRLTRRIPAIPLLIVPWLLSGNVRTCADQQYSNLIPIGSIQLYSHSTKVTVSPGLQK